MPKSDWKNNDREGKMLKSAIKQCMTKAKKAQTPEHFIDLVRVMGYLIGIKTQLVKTERDKELEKRIEELEKAAGLAQKTAPITQ